MSVTEAPVPRGRWRFLLGLAPAIIFWAILVGWLAYTLYDQTRWWRKADEANLREWLDESRVFRKSLPELARDYAAEHRKHRGEADAALAPAELPEELKDRADESREPLSALPDPPRI